MRHGFLCHAHSIIHDLNIQFFIFSTCCHKNMAFIQLFFYTVNNSIFQDRLNQQPGNIKTHKALIDFNLRHHLIPVAVILNRDVIL